MSGTVLAVKNIVKLVRS